MSDTKIDYSDKVLEVTGGCTKCALGCQNCWAIKEVWRMAHNPKLGKKWQGLVEKKNGVLNWTGKVKCFEEDAFDIPLSRKKPTTYFVDSKADLFHPKVPFHFIDAVLLQISFCPQHIFQILTKRPTRMVKYFQQLYAGLTKFHKGKKFQWPFRNIHLGVSISTPDEMWKAKVLADIPAAVRWISFEPLLQDVGEIPLENIDGVVVGGESGPGARPMHPDWVRSIRDQCVAAGVPFYFKQWGKYFPDEQFEAERKARSGSIMLPWPVSEGQIEKIGGQIYYRVGKKKASCILDGHQWKQLPERS